MHHVMHKIKNTAKITQNASCRKFKMLKINVVYVSKPNMKQAPSLFSTSNLLGSLLQIQSVSLSLCSRVSLPNCLVYKICKRNVEINTKCLTASKD